MTSNDHIENDCTGQVNDLEEKSRKNIIVPNVIKYFNNVLHCQATGSHTTRSININTKMICHCTVLP